MFDLIITGDKAYNDAELETRLWDKRRILLLPLRRKINTLSGPMMCGKLWGASDIGSKRFSAY